MAIDTRNKRFSVMGMCDMAGPMVMPNPDGTIDQADRQQFLSLYSGIAAGGGGGGGGLAGALSPLRGILGAP